jgi:hypothetical protein
LHYIAGRCNPDVNREVGKLILPASRIMYNDPKGPIALSNDPNTIRVGWGANGPNTFGAALMIDNEIKAKALY